MRIDWNPITITNARDSAGCTPKNTRDLPNIYLVFTMRLFKAIIPRMIPDNKADSPNR